jgi:hypothetical protein
MKSKEPVWLAEIARVLAALAVGAVAKYGVDLDPLQVSGLIIAAGIAGAAWVRSKVFSPHTVEKMKSAASGTA